MLIDANLNRLQLSECAHNELYKLLEELWELSSSSSSHLGGGCWTEAFEEECRRHGKTLGKVFLHGSLPFGVKIFLNKHDFMCGTLWVGALIMHQFSTSMCVFHYLQYGKRNNQFHHNQLLINMNTNWKWRSCCDIFCWTSGFIATIRNPNPIPRQYM